MKVTNRNTVILWLQTILTVCSLTYVYFRFSGLNMYTYNLMIFILLIGVYYIYRHQFRGNLFVSERALWIFSFGFSTVTVMGFYFDIGLSFENMSVINAISGLFCIMGFTLLSKPLITWLYVLIERWASKNKVKDIDKKLDFKKWFLAFCFIILAWFPVWLAYYPGLLNYDMWQIEQYMLGTFDKHHPLIHTLLFGFCYALGHKISMINMGIVLYDIIQMLIMSGIFAYAYIYVKKQIKSRIFHIGVLTFFALFPVNSIMAISTTKDVIFSGLVLLNLILTCQFLDKSENWDTLTKIINALLILCSMVLMLLFRNNASYALCLVILLGYIFVKKKHEGIKILLFLMCCLMVYRISDFVLTKAVDAEAGNVQELFSIPSQQFGRIYGVADAIGDVDSKYLIEKYYETKNLKRYDPHLSDYVKSGLNNIDSPEDMLEYFKDAVKLFFKYPLESIDSFIYLTEGSWYVNDISHADIYANRIEKRFGYLQTGVFAGYGVVHDSKFPLLESILERAFTDNEYQKIPILSIVFAPALYFWVLVFCYVGFIYSKNWNYLFISSFLLALYLTILAGPCTLVRYSYPFFVCCPILICMLVKSVQGIKNNDNP